MARVSESDLLNGAEHDIAASHATPDGYGRLTLRYQHEKVRYELYDIHHEIVVLSDGDLSDLVAKTQEFMDCFVEYDGDRERIIEAAEYTPPKKVADGVWVQGPPDDPQW